MCCPLVFEFSVGIGGFVIGLGQISFFFSLLTGDSGFFLLYFLDSRIRYTCLDTHLFRKFERNKMTSSFLHPTVSIILYLIT